MYFPFSSPKRLWISEASISARFACRTSAIGDPVTQSPVNSAAEDNYGIPAGLYVSAVEVGSPAYSAGIQTGDIITRIDAKTIENMSDFMDKLNAADSGDIMTVTVKRKSRDSYKEIVFRVTLGVE